jgi:isopropanol dehydrogenase (NADP+)
MADATIASDTMKAFVLRRLEKSTSVKKPIPEPGHNEAVVRTTTAMVCTTDVHNVRGAIPVKSNVTPGHEAVGDVHGLGSAVEGFSEGDRVAVAGVTPCFQCDYCQRGFSTQCQGKMLGGAKFTVHRDGNMGQYFLVNNAQTNLAPIPEVSSTTGLCMRPTCSRSGSWAPSMRSSSSVRRSQSSPKAR